MSIPSGGMPPPASAPGSAAGGSGAAAAGSDPDPDKDPQQAEAVEWIVRAACQRHPGLSWDLAQHLAAAAWEQAEEHGEDAPEIARRILAADPGADASATAVVAAAAVECVHAARSGSPSA